MRGPAEDGVNGVPAHPEKGSMRGPAEDGVNGVLAQRPIQSTVRCSRPKRFGLFRRELSEKGKLLCQGSAPTILQEKVRATHSHPFLRFNFLFSF